MPSDVAVTPPLVINGREYLLPSRPVVIICFDGCDKEYIDAAMARSAIPSLAAMMRDGFASTALAAVPTFTNPNNVAIVCGAPPAVTGVSGNYYLDRETGREVMVLDGALLQADTILARMAAAGVPVAVVTAKDKLLRALARGLDGIAFSAEAPPEALALSLGLDTTSPDRYSALLSLYVLDAGLALLRQKRAKLLYLSLSDYVQHSYGPEASEAIAFMSAVDQRIGQLLEQGAVVGIVADHGMTEMSRPDGSPNVVFVQDEINARFGTGAVRVICPITDPFARHHAALGGFVRVYLNDVATVGLNEIRSFIAGMEGVDVALTGAEACDRFELPMQHEADIVVIAAEGVALGATASEHDLSQLAGTRLRSHGGTSEQTVPFILSHQLRDGFSERAEAGLRNFDIFDYALNGAA